MPFRDKEKQKAYNKAYWKANCEKLKADNKIWRKANPDKKIAHDKVYYERHQEKRRQYGRDYMKANPEKHRQSQAKRRALKRTTQVETINEKIVYLRNGWICQICHKRVNKKLKYPNPMSASLDHIIPLSQGGTHTYSNVQLAHFRCNSGKKNGTLPQGEQIRLF